MRFSSQERTQFEDLKKQKNLLDSIAISSEERRDIEALRKANQDFGTMGGMLSKLRLAQEQRTELEFLRRYYHDSITNVCMIILMHSKEVY